MINNDFSYLNHSSQNNEDLNGISGIIPEELTYNKKRRVRTKPRKLKNLGIKGESSNTTLNEPKGNRNSFLEDLLDRYGSQKRKAVYHHPTQ